MKAGVKAFGVVRDEHGEPLAGVNVLLYGRLQRGFDPIQDKHETKTDERGRWSTISLSLIKYSVHFDLDGYEGGQKAFMAPSGRSIDVVLKRMDTD